MRLPRGSAFTLLSIATGVVAALAVGTTWFPMMQERERRALDDQARELELVAALAMDRLVGELLETDPPLMQARPNDARDLPMPPEQVAEIRTRAEEAFGRTAMLADLERIFLVDRRGRLLASEPARPTAVYGDIVPDPALDACGLDRVIQDRRRARAVYEEPRRQRRQVICLPFREGDGAVLGAVAVVGYSEPVVLASRQGSRELMLLLTAATVAGLVTVAGMRRLLAPLTEVSRAAARIATGERGVRVEPRGPQEVQQLARAINALAGAVESREDEIDGRMQVVQQLSGMVAHEVRNPLQSLSLLASLARTEEDREAQEQQLHLIEDEIKVLEGVVKRFLSNAGPLRIARTQTDLVQILDRAASIAYPRAAEANVRLLIQAPARLDCYADGSLVRRALENLILNAIEFAGKNRRGAKGRRPGQDHPGQVMASVLRRGDQAMLIVDDDGPGVPIDERERIFQPYISSKAGGTGLGLALVRQVFDAHGGYIRCEPSPLGGARFVAAFPLHPTPGGEG